MINIKKDLEGLVASCNVMLPKMLKSVPSLSLLRLWNEWQRLPPKTVTAVKLTDDDMKGRIIGKEGRNIQAIQRATGVDILVDDTPGMVIMSSLIQSVDKLPE